MKLRITTPLEILVEDEVQAVRAEDASGYFGILPGHADFLTRLEISVVSWTHPDGATFYCAVRGGVLTMSGGQELAIATPEAVVGPDLPRLEEMVRTAFQEKQEAERVEHTAQAQLQLNAIRQIMKHLRAGRRAALQL